MVATREENLVPGFGGYLRELRERKLAQDPAFTLRGWAKMVGLSPSYLSSVENDQTKPPHPRHLRIMATLLDTDYEELLAKSGRITDELEEILVESASARLLVRLAAALSPEELATVLRVVRTCTEHGDASDMFDRLAEAISEGKTGSRQVRF
jgi:transcriptional regulator with XRE-family HTH domain